MANAAIVIFNSAEAATYKTDLKGWVSRDGMYFGENERTARWSGCTHMTCVCGAVHEKGRTVCRSCEAIKDASIAKEPKEPTQDFPHVDSGEKR